MSKTLLLIHDAACWPVHMLAEMSHKRVPKLRKEHTRFAIGGVFMVVGAGAAKVIPHLMHLSLGGEVMLDMTAYAVHGCGTIPFITIVIKRFALEGEGHGPVKPEAKHSTRNHLTIVRRF